MSDTATFKCGKCGRTTDQARKLAGSIVCVGKGLRHRATVMRMVK